MIPFAVLSALLLAALIYERVNSRREREKMLKAVNLAITEGTKERDTLRKERQEILNRKAQGDKAVIYDMPDEGESQAVTYGDDEAFWEYKRGQMNGD